MGAVASAARLRPTRSGACFRVASQVAELRAAGARMAAAERAAEFDRRLDGALAAEVRGRGRAFRAPCRQPPSAFPHPHWAAASMRPHRYGGRSRRRRPSD